MPYNHLARILWLCIVHFKQNIKKLEGKVPPEIITAMYSLASSEPLADFDGTLQLIQRSGQDAKSLLSWYCSYFTIVHLRFSVLDWLHDKEVASPFAVPALYQPRS